ncbi:MAG TPA: hypothetical protein VFK16_12070 [Gemmatimonadaceae bacterium]|jgi:hypothetical protein|nr:hypothetical protein [Gemmatimonadaceae bacterium]
MNRRIAGFLMVFLLAGVTRLAQAQARANDGPTDKIAKCIDDAAQRFVDCTQDGGAWYKILCASRYASDAFFCLPSGVRPKLM